MDQGEINTSSVMGLRHKGATNGRNKQSDAAMFHEVCKCFFFIILWFDIYLYLVKSFSRQKRVMKLDLLKCNIIDNVAAGRMINGYLQSAAICCLGVADYVTSDKWQYHTRVTRGPGVNRGHRGNNVPLLQLRFRGGRAICQLLHNLLTGPGDKNAKWPTLFIQTVLYYCILWEVIP